MNPRTTGLLALVALLLGGFVYFYELEGETEREAARDAEKRVHVGLEADDVRAIAFTSQDGIAARFERRAGSWRIVSPVEGAADGSALDAIAFALTNLPREGSVASDGALDPFGLGAEARVVRFEIEGAESEEPLGIRIGGDTPVGGHVYLARLADDEVAYVERYRLNALNRDLADLRERRISAFEAGEVEKLTLSWPGDAGPVELELERDEDSEWQIRAPLSSRADAQTVRELVSNVAFLRAAGFVDERDAEIDAALAEPVLQLRLQLAGEDAPRSLRIGGTLGEGRLVETGEGRLFTIDPERLDDFARTIPAYRYKLLSEFEVASARRLVLDLRRATRDPEASNGSAAAEATRVIVELGETGWSRSGGEPALDPDRVSDLVRAIASLRAVDILADEMGEAERASLGLAPPRVSIRVFEQTGEADESGIEALAELSIGRVDEARGVFAQRQGDPTIFVLPAEAALDLPVSLEAFEAEFAVPIAEAAGDVAEAVDVGEISP